MDLIPRSWTSAPEISLSTSTIPNIVDDTGTYTNATLTVDTSTIGSSVELFQGYSDELLTFASIMCIIFTLIGIPGNLITIIALSKCNKARNATAIFIINLSLSDLLFCGFNLPLAASTFLKRSWNHGDTLCRLFPLMRYGLLAVSLVTILLITINRYVMIGHPRIYPRIYRNRYLAIMVSGTWIVAFSILIPTYRGMWGAFGLDTEIGSCSILMDENGNSPKEFLFIIAFVVPCFCIFVCYARIFYIVRKTALRSQAPASIGSSVRFGKTNAAHENNDSDQQLLDKNSKASKDEQSDQSLSISDISPNEKQRVHAQKNTQEEQWQMRPYLSKVRDDEMKYIDTSVESDFPPSLSVLKIRGKPEAISISTSKNDLIYEATDVQLTFNAEAMFEEDDSGYDKEVSEGVAAPNGTIEAFITEVPLKASDTSDEADKKSKLSYKSTLKTSLNRVTKRKFHNNSTINTSNASVLYPGRMSQKDRRLLKMILVIFLSFVICYLPITITKLWKGVTEMHFLNISGYLLIYLTTCINPFIYVVMSSEYRQAYMNLLRCKIGNKSSHNQRYAAVTKKNSTVKLKPQT